MTLVFDIWLDETEAKIVISMKKRKNIVIKRKNILKLIEASGLYLE